MKSVTAGAKKNGGPHHERLEAHASPYLKELFQEAADVRGVTLSDFIISSAHDVAVDTLERHKVIKLNREASIQFANALLRPPRSNPRLRAAARRYMRAAKAKPAA
jgi:uncharacterized protein (DUF1778 family)